MHLLAMGKINLLTQFFVLLASVASYQVTSAQEPLI